MSKLVVACFLLGVYLIGDAFRRIKRAQTLASISLSKLASAPQGWVRVEGFAWPQDNQVTLSSTGDEVVYSSLKIEVEQQSGSGKSRHTEWVTVFHEQFQHPFYIMDPSGLALIDPSGSEVELGSPRKRLWKDLTPEQQSRVTERVGQHSISGFPPKDQFFGLFANHYRILEVEITVGSPLFVSGDFSSLESGTHAVQESGLTAFAERVINTQSRSFRHLAQALDTNHDGKVSAVEASRGYTLIAKAVRAMSEQEQDFQVYGQLHSSEKRKLFLATYHHQHLSQKLKSWLVPRFIAGAAMVALALSSSSAQWSRQQRTPSSMLPNSSSQQESASDATALHTQCVAGQLRSCERLLYLRRSYQLDEKYVSYYEGAACRAGGQYYCQPVKPGVGHD